MDVVFKLIEYKRSISSDILPLTEVNVSGEFPLNSSLPGIPFVIIYHVISIWLELSEIIRRLFDVDKDRMIKVL